MAATCVGDWGTSAEGASVERRRREDRGVPPVPPPQKKIVLISELKKGEFWCIVGATFAVELNGNWLGY